MTKSRSEIIIPEQTRYYHCISRCVRRAFLCGTDRYTGKNYDYRRARIEKDMLKYARIFCLNIYAYSVMSNHTHILLEIDDLEACSLTYKQVLKRYHKIFKPLKIEEKFLAGDKLEKEETELLKVRVAMYRRRLSSISW